MVDGVDEEGEAENVGEENEFLDLRKRMELGNDGECLAYLPDITAHLACGGQELYGRHPFFGAESCFTSEAVEVGDESFENILKPAV